MKEVEQSNRGKRHKSKLQIEASKKALYQFSSLCRKWNLIIVDQHRPRIISNQIGNQKHNYIYFMSKNGV